jgi:hypothetical protein
MASGADHKRALAESAGLCILAPTPRMYTGSRAGVADRPDGPEREGWSSPGEVFTESQGALAWPEGNLAMTRRARDLTFRKNDAIRAIKAAQAAGIPNPRIEIDRHGTISIIAGEPPLKDGTVPEAEPTPLLQGGAGGR